MNADIKGALQHLDRSWRSFTHRGKRMTKDEVEKVLQKGLLMGKKTTDEFTDEEVDKVLGWKGGDK